MFRLISAHRLDQEKWRDLIIWWLTHPDTQPYLQQWLISYDIYGDWSMKADIQRLNTLYPWAIRYHGYLPLDQIIAKPMAYDFVLMPSHFLETFWLTALDFAQFWVPTIGFQKWWLKQFVSEYCAIPEWPPETVQDRFNTHLMKIMNDVLNKKIPSWWVDKKHIQKTYGTQQWLNHFTSLLPHQ